MAYALRELICERTRGAVLSERLSWCPPTVDASTIRSYLRHRFGEPLDVAYTELPDLGPVQVGWTYALPSDATVPGRRDAYAPVAIPLYEDPDDGSLVSLFVRQAEYHRLGQTLLEAGTVASVEHVPIEEAEWEPGEPAP